MDYLTVHGKFADAEKVWRRIDANPSGLKPQWVSYYMNALVGAGLADRADEVWTQLKRHQLISEPAEPDNLVSNGDFEGELKNLGFGWRIDDVPGVYAGRDSTVFHSGGHSLVISFPGTSNFYYHAVWHYVKVTPGVRYRAEAYLKTDGITTDSGPRLQVEDIYNPKALNVFSDQLLGTNAAWTLVTVDFTPPEKTRYVIVAIARVPSEKLDNKIAGKVWADDVKVSPLEPRSADARR
jgi:hypothetical protein